MNSTWKCALVIGGKVYAATKQIHDVTLHDVIGGHQAYINRKIDREMGNPILQLVKTTRGERASRVTRL